MKRAFLFLIGLTACDQVSYHNDVKPLMDEHCVSCHRDGGLAPFALETYEQVQALSGSIADSVSTGRMPPFVVDNSGDCQTYQDARWVSPAGRATVQQWHEDGAAEGSATAATTPIPPIEYVTADLTIQTPPYKPGKRPDDYRCFVFENVLEANTYMTALQVRPGSTAMTHHLLLFAVDGQATKDKMLQRARNDTSGPGFDCISTPYELFVGGSRLLASWAPGIPVNRFPEGTGMRLSPDTMIVAQMHYNSAAKLEQDSSSIDLLLSDTVEKEAYVQLIDDTDLEVPAGLTDATYESTFWLNHPALHAFFPFDSEGIDAIGVGPHMHGLGRQQRFEYVDRHGQSTCLHQVNDWDYAWQEYFYFADGPIHIDRSGTLKLTCTYDTTALKRSLTWGEGTDDEMCMAFLFYTKTSENP